MTNGEAAEKLNFHVGVGISLCGFFRPEKGEPVSMRPSQPVRGLWGRSPGSETTRFRPRFDREFVCADEQTRT